jgi:hypothetical protein
MTTPEEAELRAAVLRRLDHLDQLAEQCTPDRPAEPARTAPPAGAVVAGEVELPEQASARNELGRLADGWKLLLETHGPGPDGHCLACSGSRRHRRWPCGVWLTASRHLLDDGGDPASGPRRPSRRNPPLPRPRQHDS